MYNNTFNNHNILKNTHRLIIIFQQYFEVGNTKKWNTKAIIKVEDKAIKLYNLYK